MSSSIHDSLPIHSRISVMPTVLRIAVTAMVPGAFLGRVGRSSAPFEFFSKQPAGYMLVISLIRIVERSYLINVYVTVCPATLNKINPSDAEKGLFSKENGVYSG